MLAVVYIDEKPDDVGVDLWLRVGENLRTGEDDVAKVFSNLTSLEKDLLTVSSAVLAMDVAAKRSRLENIVRDMRIRIPVVNFTAFNSQRLLLQRILHRLSDDKWEVEFIRAPGEQESLISWPSVCGRTLLFSGGLDSLAAAVDLLDEHGAQNVQLASHRTGNTLTISTQNQLHDYLQEQYGQIARITARTGGKDTEEAAYPTEDLEISQRTRSFMFLCIAALAARRRGMSEVVMIAENGQLAIHVPLSGGRFGAFSTHTAHPEFIAKAAEFLSEVMQFRINITNPYQYKTKAEVVAKLATSHASAIALSMSCWKGHRVGGHCGFCIPCMIRRIALEHHGIRVDDWRRDIFTESVGQLPFDDDGKRNITELIAFAQDFRQMSDAELDMEHCDVNSSFFDRDAAVAMYRRFAQEAVGVIQHYENLGYLLA